MDFARLILFILLFFPTYIFAQVDVSFYDSPVLEKTKSGDWRTSIGVEVKSNNFPSKRLKTSVALSSLSAGKMVLKAISRATPYAVALSVAMEAYGYFFNKSSGLINVKDDTVVHKSDFQSVSFLCNVGPQAGYYPAENKLFYGYSVFIDDGNFPSSNYLVINNCPNNKVKLFVYKDYSTFIDREEKERKIEYINVPTHREGSIDNLGDLFLENNIPLLQSSITEAIKSGTYEQDWPELKLRIDNIRNSFDSADRALEPVNGINPDIGVEEYSSDKSFCDWAPKLCALADFFMETSESPQNPSLPVKEISPVKWESGLPSGSCPTLPAVVFQGQSMTYDLSNACWAASSVFKPILISLSLIGAAFILAGVRL